MWSEQATTAIQMQGKQILLFLIVSGIGILGSLFLTYGYEATWELWNIPVMTPHFADLRSITGGAESSAAGLDPLYENPGDPWARPMNYPRIWQSLFALGLNQQHTTLMGLFFIGLFVIGSVIFVDQINSVTAFCLALGIFSPAILLGVERANNDLFIFFLLAVVLACVIHRPWLSMILVNVAFVLKLFPLFGLLALLDEDRRRSRKLLTISFVVALLYLGLTYRDVVQIGHATQKGSDYSYGTNVIGFHLANLLQRPRIESVLFWLLTVGIFALVAPLLLSFAAKVQKKVTANGREQGNATAYLPAFKLGAGIYIGTFLLGNNFDYRMVFLLFVVPQLVQWSAHPLFQIRWPARMTLGAILLSWWASLLFQPLLAMPMGDDIALVLDESVNWLAFIGLLYLLLTALPFWLWQTSSWLPLRIAGSDQPTTSTEAMP